MLSIRPLAGTLAVALLGVTTIGGALPATASETWTTTTVASPGATVVDYGETIEIEVDIDSQSGFSPTAGTSTLYAMKSTSTEWEAIATNASPSLDFVDVRPRIKTSYKVVYNGHTAASSQDDTYAASESAVFTVKVARTISHPEDGFDLRGKVRPDYGNRKIVVKISSEQDTGYTRVKTIKTDARGRYRIRLPRRVGTWYWSFVVKGDSDYLGTSFVWQTWVSDRTAP